VLFCVHVCVNVTVYTQPNVMTDAEIAGAARSMLARQLGLTPAQRLLLDVDVRRKDQMAQKGAPRFLLVLDGGLCNDPPAV
jgi:hypothetical protein